ncbi:TonB-dependent receptor [Bacteroides stercoris]|jgi:TonB-linked SusC/RagA family outer membrane protein|uniref:TonB-dependent receptor n=1 Tax=Bacteroides stercoris TaxID=46506 RepID=A0A3E4UPD2_BACSE|nr:TonB-dependent receptor [Bacteroides stercoris]RGM13446.1 TonB-dependent receptor [Bacteroides stercoris]RGR28494.1 TonB-dependent receptor [Bacteroides stercoris]RGR37417.1 TonB-dependent receptor [Bacteroides stercoris]
MKNILNFNVRYLCFVFVMLVVQCAFAQDRTITGTVTDNKQEPLIGVNVVVKGNTSVGAITDLDGKYSLSVPEGKTTLIFSYIGYVTQEVSVGLRNTVDVVLVDDAQALDEVVVVGYGVVKKRDLVGSIASVKSQDITAVPTSNVLESMQGKIAGLDMTRSSGQPGSSFNFTIRGNRSLTASNAPLILVDGIAYGTDIDINPNDVESIEVLKDASTTAIYGSRGANGVILVTTKKGKEGKTKVDFNAYWGPSFSTNLPKVNNTEQYVAMRREAMRAVGQWTSPADDGVIWDAVALERIKNNVNTDWYDLIMDDATTQNYQVSINGGTDATKVSLSLDYFNETGILIGDDFDRFNGRINVSQRIMKGMEAGASALFTTSTRSAAPSNVFHAAQTKEPYGVPFNEDGSLNKYPFTGSGATDINMLFNQDKNNYVDETKSNRFFGTLFLNWEIIKGLQFRTNFGYDSQNSRNGHFEGVNSTFVGSNKGLAKVSKNETHSTAWTWENTLTYTKDFDIHSLTAMVGHSMSKSSFEDTYAEGKGLSFEQSLFHNLDGTSQDYALSSTLTESSMLSYFARLNYKLLDKYLLTATLRADGSSVLAKGNRWGYFPSVAVAWRMKDEHFLSSVDEISDLKLRLSYGLSGNSAVSPYQTTGGLSKTIYEFGTIPAYGYRPYNMANLELQWEKTRVLNFGVDFGLFNNRIYATIDAYKTWTSDLLLPMILPGHTGFTEVISNVGKTETRGIDLSINTVNFDTKDFKWTSDLTFSANKEEITALNTNQNDVGSGWFIGSPTKVFYDYEKIGIWQTSEATEAAKYGQEPGDIKVSDQNKDGAIDANNDRKVLGQQTPKWTAGLNNRFEYKGWELSFFLYARVGHLIQNEAAANFNPSGWNNSIACDYWTPENPTNAYPRPNFNKNESMLYKSTLAYCKGNFLKIKDITFGYSFPKQMISKLNMSKLRIYTTLKNFFTFSAVDDYDPERGGSNSYPMTKQVVFGINVSF